MTGADIWNKIFPWIKNKYILTIAIFLLWMLIFDSSNWVDVYREYSKIKKLNKEKEYYLEKIEEDRQKLEELQTNNENLEKFAREQYLMKKPNEDIFVIMPD
ncbi:MAG TPA: septum formation initiator family protein [Perlabentimonas sp.]|nr:septum formation initiator family protein [Bacteroidales bacterium]MDD4672758.1 septum formation initiator family protein [Bacteroidales bacterium]MDY0347776.1 septum formation initiator family protein [Tenuifilaceae bacterium]HZJ74330.1 septum formation initiator family protein [Perlabentimonas sp.]